MLGDDRVPRSVAVNTFWGGQATTQGPAGATGATGPAGPGPLIVHKAADEIVNNSAALQADNHLTATLTGGAKYRFVFEVFFTDSTAAQAGGIKVSIGGAATATNLIAKVTLISDDLAAIGEAKRFSALGQTSETAGSITGSATISGTIEVNAGGTFRLEWSQATATAGDLTVQRGSTLSYQEIT